MGILFPVGRGIIFTVLLCGIVLNQCKKTYTQLPLNFSVNRERKQKNIQNHVKIQPKFTYAYKTEEYPKQRRYDTA
jgi:hypothetical protein